MSPYVQLDVTVASASVVDREKPYRGADFFVHCGNWMPNQSEDNLSWPLPTVFT